LRKRLERNFGEAVTCRFVDVESAELQRYPEIAERLRRRGKAALPIVAFNGKVRYSGIFSPTFIQRDLRELLGEKAGTGTRRPGPRSFDLRGAGTAGWGSARLAGRGPGAVSSHRTFR